MKCKFCNADMEDGVTRCPVCGKDNLPEDTQQGAEPVEEITAPEQAADGSAASWPAEKTADKKKPKVWKIVLAVLGCVVLLGVLAGAVLYGLGVDLRPKANDIFYKDSYFVSDKKAKKAADTVVATVGDMKLTNSELQVYYQMSIANFANYYGGYTSMLGVDLSKPLDTQVQDKESGLTWQQYFLKSSVETWQRYATIRMFAKEDGFQADDKTNEMLANLKSDLEKTAQEAGLASIGELTAKEMGASATEEGYFNYLSGYYESLAYYDKVYADMTPSEEEIQAHFTQNEDKFAESGVTKDSGTYVDVRHILLAPEGGSKGEDGRFTYSDEEWAVCEKKAQELLDQWLAGEATEDSFAELAGIHSIDGSKTRGGLYTQVTKGQMVKPFEDWCFDESRKPGDYGIVKTEYGYHLMYFVNSEDIWHYTAMSDYMTENTNKMLDEGMKQWPLQANYKKMVLSRLETEESAKPTEGTSSTETAPSETDAVQESTQP